MSRDLILFALANGAEVIGRIDSYHPEKDEFTLEHPLVIRPVQRGPNDFALDLFPHSLANPEGKHRFNRSVFLSESEDIPAPLEKAYLERTSKIILAGQLDKLEGLVK